MLLDLDGGHHLRLLHITELLGNSAAAVRSPKELHWEKKKYVNFYFLSIITQNFKEIQIDKAKVHCPNCFLCDEKKVSEIDWKSWWLTELAAAWLKSWKKSVAAAGELVWWSLKIVHVKRQYRLFHQLAIGGKNVHDPLCWMKTKPNPFHVVWYS